MPAVATLIGFPTSGKTTVGALVAQQSGRDFLDTDLLLQQTLDEPLADLVRRSKAEFRQREDDVVCALMPTQPAIVSTGGSVVYSDRAMQHLTSLGPVVYLQVGMDELARRLATAPTRAIVVPDGQTWDDVLRQRHQLYSRYASVVVPSIGTPQQTATQVLERI